MKSKKYALTQDETAREGRKEVPMKIDLTKPMYLVQENLANSSIGDRDYLTNDLDELRDWLIDENPWDVDDPEGEAETIIADHVSDADADAITIDSLGVVWYNMDGDWYTVDDQGFLSAENWLDGPHEVDEDVELKNFSAYESWRKTVHPSHQSDSDYQKIKRIYNRFHTCYAPAGTSELIKSRNWVSENSAVGIDLTPRVLDSGLRLMSLADAFANGYIRFVTHGRVHVLEVGYSAYGGPRREWRDVHTFGPIQFSKYTNRSAARLPYDYDNENSPECPFPAEIRDWHVGVDEFGVVQWTISPLGVDFTSGGHSTCNLRDAAFQVNAIRARV